MREFNRTAKPVILSLAKQGNPTIGGAQPFCGQELESWTQKVIKPITNCKHHQALWQTDRLGGARGAGALSVYEILDIRTGEI
jgi:hypothetical protein